MQRTVVDAAGNAYAVGFFAGTLQLGSFTLVSNGGDDLFVARLSPAGQWTQAVAAGGTADESADVVALDPRGGVVVGGNFASTQFALGSTALAANGQHNAYVARLDAGGTWQQATAATARTCNDLEVRATGEVVLTGDLHGLAVPVRFGTLTIPPTGGHVFVARLSPAGQWTQLVGFGGTCDFATALALDAAGNATVVGEFRAPTLTLGSTVLTNANTTSNAMGCRAPNGFLAQLSAAGTWTQAQAYAHPSSSTLQDIQLAPNGETVLLGSFWGPSFQLGTLTVMAVVPGATASEFVARRSAAGIWTQASAFGDGLRSFTLRLAVDAASNAVVAGTYCGARMHFGNQYLLNSAPNPDPFQCSGEVFAARLSPTGQWLQALSAGGPGDDIAGDFCLDAAGNVLVNGSLAGPLSTFGSRTVTGPPRLSAFVAKAAFVPTATAPAAVQAPLALWPNPARAAATLVLAPVASARSAQLLDALGRAGRTLAVPAGAAAVPVDLTGLAPGVYLLRCGTAMSRLMVE